MINKWKDSNLKNFVKKNLNYRDLKRKKYVLFNEFQHDRFSAAADAGHNFYQIGSNKWTDATHIQFTFDHE